MSAPAAWPVMPALGALEPRRAKGAACKVDRKAEATSRRQMDEVNARADGLPAAAFGSVKKPGQRMITIPLPALIEIIFVLCVMLVALAGACLFLLLRTNRRRAQSSGVATVAPPPAASREMNVISKIMRTYIHESRNYSRYLNRTNEQLTRPIEQVELMSVVQCLIMENTALLDSSYELQLRLEESKQRIDALTQDLDTAREKSQQDALTQLYGRRFFDEALPKCIASAKEDDRQLCLMLIDIDAFKHINDASGHLAGDEIIKSVGALIAGSVRRSDVAARYGGDEFAVILPGASKGDAVHIAERMQSLLSIKKWRQNGNDGPDAVTVSIGIASLSSSDSAKDLFERADASLYKAKASGKNRVAVR
jgi:diguanylate cyclase